VQGEICNLTRAASGHWYFGLKDDSAKCAASCSAGRNSLLDWLPREGDDVEVNAIVSLYEARGEFQLNIESMRRAGLGGCTKSSCGSSSASRPRAVRSTATTVAAAAAPRRCRDLVQAAALRDVLSALQRRAPYLQVVVYPVPVQGTGAGEQIAAMLARVSARAEVDVVLLVRGGGSIEDLWSFNEEAVARAIARSVLPVVVVSVTKATSRSRDLAADVRAPTPTAAAELVARRHRACATTSPRSCGIWHVNCGATAGCRPAHRLRRAAPGDAARGPGSARVTPRRPAVTCRDCRSALRGAFASRLASLQARCMQARPQPDMAGVLACRNRVVAFGRSTISERGLRLMPLVGRLTALDPQAVLRRGYAMALDASGRAVTRASTLAAGDRLQIVLSRGRPAYASKPSTTIAPIRVRARTEPATIESPFPP